MNHLKKQKNYYGRIAKHRKLLHSINYQQVDRGLKLLNLKYNNKARPE